ncbi:MAG: epoxyqueuosine reductase [Phycisphaerales bacterium]|nr:MAG: epoxyqueuosine reductase [Phycisphaerales bacterium]
MASEGKLIETLLSTLREHGYRGRVVPVGRLRDLKQEIEAYYREGFFDAEFYQEELAALHFGPPATLPTARSVILATASQPQVRVTFTWKGKHVPLVVPPTYSQKTDRLIERLVADALATRDYRIVRAGVPKKSLAVRCGLGEYGRNNIVYVQGMGSFHRLVAFFSDLPCEDDNWRAPQLAERCRKCRACIDACPTGAIDRKRFLLRAERCITFRNEKPRNVPFPAWLDSSWHNCLAGCMNCQRFCPLDKDFVDWFEYGATFTDQETRLFLRGATLEQLPDSTVKKLEQSEMLEFLDLFPRNLPVLLRERVSG